MPVKAIYVELLEEQNCPCAKARLEDKLTAAETQAERDKTKIAELEKELDATKSELNATKAQLTQTPPTPSKPNFACDEWATIWITEDGSPTTVDEAVRVLSEKYPKSTFTVESNGIIEHQSFSDGGGRNRRLPVTKESLAKVGAICTNVPWHTIATIAT